MANPKKYAKIRIKNSQVLKKKEFRLGGLSDPQFLGADTPLKRLVRFLCSPELP